MISWSVWWFVVVVVVGVVLEENERERDFEESGNMERGQIVKKRGR